MIDFGIDTVKLDGGRFDMGSTAFYPEESPVIAVTVASFRIGRTPVTNAQFGRFVDETGYVTTAERPLDPAQFPGARNLDTTPGSLVFTPTSGPVGLRDWRQWWAWVPGAHWRDPDGSGAGLADRADHPVVQISHDDALAFCAWAGMRLPTEAEWEYAARGGLERATFPWGDEPNGPHPLRANTWQGHFPYENWGASGWVGTSPVGSFPPSGFGLVDVVGNVWEWTSTPWSSRHMQPSSCGCSPAGSTKPGEQRLVTKGGSHLCAPEYCLRYRPAARSPQTRDSSTTHMGFRVAAD